MENCLIPNGKQDRYCPIGSKFERRKCKVIALLVLLMALLCGGNTAFGQSSQWEGVLTTPLSGAEYLEFVPNSNWPEDYDPCGVAIQVGPAGEDVSMDFSAPTIWPPDEQEIGLVYRKGSQTVAILRIRAGGGLVLVDDLDL